MSSYQQFAPCNESEWTLPKHPGHLDLQICCALGNVLFKDTVYCDLNIVFNLDVGMCINSSTIYIFCHCAVCDVLFMDSTCSQLNEQLLGTSPCPWWAVSKEKGLSFVHLNMPTLKC